MLKLLNNNYVLTQNEKNLELKFLEFLINLVFLINIRDFIEKLILQFLKVFLNNNSWWLN